MSEPLTPIPTPPAHMWRQVRLQYLPGIVFAIGLVTAVVLWMHWVTPSSMVGEAEGLHADVRAPHLGLLVDLKVEPLQTVKAGQEIGHIAAADPHVLEASLSVIRSEIDELRATMNPVIAQQRMQLDSERLRLDWMSERVKLASLKAQSQLAEANYTRSEGLYKNKMITDERFDEVKTARESLRAQVEAQSELVTQLDPGMKQFSANTQSAQLPSPADGLRAALKVQEDKLRLTEVQLGTRPLLAPIDGVVSIIFRHAGETVKAAEVIAHVTSPHVDRIVGFMRQPLSLEPKPGMTVEVRTRTFHRQEAHATITAVGSQFEPIGPALLAAMHLPNSATGTELGLRVSITAPAGLALKPGEHVDLILPGQ